MNIFPRRAAPRRKDSRKIEFFSLRALSDILEQIRACPTFLLYAYIEDLNPHTAAHLLHTCVNRHLQLVASQLKGIRDRTFGQLIAAAAQCTQR